MTCTVISKQARKDSVAVKGIFNLGWKKKLLYGVLAWSAETPTTSKEKSGIGEQMFEEQISSV